MFGIGDDAGFGAAKEANARNRQMFEGIDLPIYKQFSPELFSNETANYELVNDNPLLKSAQQAALAKMAGLADSGLSDVDQAGYEKARQLAGQVQKQGNAAAMQSAATRGVGGSGLEFAMREMAGQDAAQRAQDAGLQQAADSARQRALYAQAYGTQLAGARDQDARTAQTNAGIINQFNTMNTQNRNSVNNANSNLRNSAFQYNEGLKDRNFANQTGRASNIAGINNQAGQIGAAESAASRAKSGQMVGMIGAGVGAMYGGPAGAAAGYQIGNAVGS